MVTYKRVMDALDGLEGLMRRVAEGDVADLRGEARSQIEVVHTLRQAVEERFGETTGERPERALAMTEILRQPRSEMLFASRPTFIIGYRRSGTTLLAWLLDSHPAMCAVPENSLCRNLIGEEDIELPEIYERRVQLVRAYLGIEELGETREGFFNRVAYLVDSVFADYARRQGKRRWVNKELFLHPSLDLLDALFGYNAQYIYMVRHGLDVAYSASERFGYALGTPIVRDGSLNLRNYLRFWADANEHLMDFYERNRERCQLVRYEELVEDPGARAQELFDFLGEPRHDAILDDMQRQEHATGLGDNKIYATGGRVDPSRRRRWEEWPPELVRQLGRVANPTLERLGYPAVGGDG